MIPKLRALAKNRPDLVGQLPPLLPGDTAEHPGFTFRWVENSGQDFDGRRFPSPIRPDEAQQLPLFHFKRQLPNSLNGNMFRLY
jgi:hypothetical protein